MSAGLPRRPASQPASQQADAGTHQEANDRLNPGHGFVESGFVSEVADDDADVVSVVVEVLRQFVGAADVEHERGRGREGEGLFDEGQTCAALQKRSGRRRRIRGRMVRHLSPSVAHL